MPLPVKCGRIGDAPDWFDVALQGSELPNMDRYQTSNEWCGAWSPCSTWRSGNIGTDTGHASTSKITRPAHSKYRNRAIGHAVQAVLAYLLSSCGQMQGGGAQDRPFPLGYKPFWQCRS